MTFLYVSSVTGAVMLKVGDAAPSFSLPGSDDQIHSLADYKGKQVLVSARFTKAYSNASTAECQSLHGERDQIRVFHPAHSAVRLAPLHTNATFSSTLGHIYPFIRQP